MYNPDDARFLQEDTYNGNPTDILSLNIYTYCVGNPLKYIDPTGHTPTDSQSSGTNRSGYAYTGDAANSGNGSVESFDEYFSNRKLTICAALDWVLMYLDSLVYQTSQDVWRDLRNAFALPDSLKASFADTLAYLDDIKEEVAVITTTTALVVGGVMVMPTSPTIGTGLVSAGVSVASKGILEFVQNGKVTGSFSDYAKTGIAGFAAGSVSMAIASYGAAAGVTGVGNSLLASAGDMAANATTQYILTGKVDPKEVIISGVTGFICSEGIRQVAIVASPIRSTKSLQKYSSTQKIVSSVDDYADDASNAYFKKVQTLEKNRLQGKLFANEKFAEFQKISSNAEREITIQPYGYKYKIRVDAIGNLNDNGKLVIYEYKSSKYAPLTKNQSEGFVFLAEYGGVIVGKGKDYFRGGDPIPPMVVDVVRPD